MSRSKNTKKVALPELAASFIVAVAKALIAITKHVAVLRVAVKAFKRAYGKAAPKLLGKLRRGVRTELGLNGTSDSVKAQWNSRRVQLDRVCREEGLVKGKKQGGKKISSAQRIVNGYTRAQIKAAWMMVK